MPTFHFRYIWKATALRPEKRKGQRCRILARGWMNSVQIEFEDGFKMVTSRYAVRQIKTPAISASGRLDGA